MRVIAAMLLVSIMLLAGISAMSGALAKGGVRLSAEEIAFAEAVGKGEYAYDIDWTYSYQYGEFEFPESSGLMAWRGAGSEPAHEYAAYLQQEMTDIGLKDVAMESFPIDAYSYKGASVQIVSPEAGPVWLAAGHGGLPGTPPEGITADIVYVGLGTRFDYMDKDVEGKLVLIDVSAWEMYWLQYPLYEAVLHNAIGAVVHWVEYGQGGDLVTSQDSESTADIPAVSISNKNAEYLKELILNSPDPVQVKIWCDATIDYEGTGYNVYGYIPGTTNPDELIVIGDHYDKWWYGSLDDGSGVARLLGIAQAMVASGYKPDKTIAFIATDAEEWGAVDAEFDCALGAYWAIFGQHPDWVGKTWAYFNLEGGGFAGATTVELWGEPETQLWRKSLQPLIDEWFMSNEPWSAYYQRCSEVTELFSGGFVDTFSFGVAGITCMNIGTPDPGDFFPNYYHTESDNMEKVSAESLAMSIISNGIVMIDLDRSSIAPYSFQKRASDIISCLDMHRLTAAGVDVTKLWNALGKFSKASGQVWSLVHSARNSDNADEINALLMLAAAKIHDMQWIGDSGYVLYPFQHYLDDSQMMRLGIQSLMGGNIDDALMFLSFVYGMYTGRMISYENYEYMQLDRWNIDSPNQFWAQGHIAHIIDIWHEHDSLLQKKAAGDSNFDAEIASLQDKYGIVVDYLQDALDRMTQTLVDSTSILLEARALLM